MPKHLHIKTNPWRLTVKRAPGSSPPPSPPWQILERSPAQHCCCCCQCYDRHTAADEVEKKAVQIMHVKARRMLRPSHLSFSDLDGEPVDDGE